LYAHSLAFRFAADNGAWTTAQMFRLSPAVVLKTPTGDPDLADSGRGQRLNARGSVSRPACIGHSGMMAATLAARLDFKAPPTGPICGAPAGSG
jgi:hypothetical protein